jgi:DNA-directed RNA polymerase subunit RPC12/RpoP
MRKVQAEYKTYECERCGKVFRLTADQIVEYTRCPRCSSILVVEKSDSVNKSAQAAHLWSSCTSRGGYS